MNTSIATTNSDHDMDVHLRDLMPMLGYTKHYDLRSRFETFFKKTYGTPAQEITDGKSVGCFKTDFFDAVTMQFVRTYAMSSENAMAFAMYVDPAKGILVLRALNTAKHEPAPIPYWTEKNLNVRLLAERYNRSISSVNITRKRDAKRIEAIGGSELHTEIRGGEVWFTEAYASCLGFTGEAAVQAKARAMVAYSDNPQLGTDKIQRLLITTTKESTK